MSSRSSSPKTPPHTPLTIACFSSPSSQATSSSESPTRLDLFSPSSQATSSPESTTEPGLLSLPPSPRTPHFTDHLEKAKFRKPLERPGLLPLPPPRTAHFTDHLEKVIFRKPLERPSTRTLFSPKKCLQCHIAGLPCSLTNSATSPTSEGLKFVSPARYLKMCEQEKRDPGDMEEKLIICSRCADGGEEFCVLRFGDRHETEDERNEELANKGEVIVYMAPGVDDVKLNKKIEELIGKKDAHSENGGWQLENGEVSRWLWRFAPRGRGDGEVEIVILRKAFELE